MKILKLQILVLLVVLAAVPQRSAASPTYFYRPIPATYWSQSYVSAWKDVNWTVGQIGDWKGGTHTYDQHGGTDFAIVTGTTVYASHWGTITDIVNNYVGNTYPNGPVVSGNRVVVDTVHTSGDGYRYIFRYSHLKTGSVLYWVGRYVNSTDALAQSDNTGYSDGAHLHLAVRRNRNNNEYDIQDTDDYSICPFQTGNYSL